MNSKTTYQKAGRYFASVDPEGHNRWKQDEREENRPATIENLGRYWESADPEGFDRWMEEYA